MAGKFVLKKGSTGKFRFNLVATNGQVIATNEAYESNASALEGIESVKRNAPARWMIKPTADTNARPHPDQGSTAKRRANPRRLGRGSL